jgi:hypothetical protein
MQKKNNAQWDGIYHSGDPKSCPFSFLVTHRATLPKLRTNHRSANGTTISVETRGINFREYALCNPVADTPIGPTPKSHTSYYWIRRRWELITRVHMASVNSVAA